MNSLSLLKATFSVGLITALSACGAYDVAELKEKTIDTSSYSGAVAEEYRKFVTSEADQMMDWQDAGYFAAKALKVLDDPTAAQPENYKDWNIDQQFVDDLEVGQGRLRIAMRLISPEEGAVNLAKAITSFDCWVEQAEEGWQIDHIAACQTSFNDALGELEQQKNIKITDAGEATVRLVVHHDLDQSHPRTEDLILIQSFASKGWDDLQLHVHVVGHTDRSGTDEHNKKLSVSRALAVVNAIKATWPGEYTFSIEGLGETNPAFATADGVEDIRNRRTEAEVTLSIEPEFPSIETATR
jgi:OmpA-OmpF porin, OOP family